MKKSILLFAFLTTTLFSTAFAATDWNGKVQDEKSEPVAYANVVILSRADSTIIGAAVTDADGKFSIKNNSKDAILMVAMLGYKTAYLNPQGAEATTQTSGTTQPSGILITLQNDTNILGAATVSAVMPKTKLTGEGLQTNVKGSVLEDAGTAKNVLEKTPGLIKTKDGLEVIGKGAPIIYINGHKVTDNEELERLLSNEVQSVEVINNPGAQYDASVSAVVRIKTVRRQGEGFGLIVRLADEQSLDRAPEVPDFKDGGKAPDNDPSANIKVNYRKNNVDVFGGLNYTKYTGFQFSNIYQHNMSAGDFVQSGDLRYDYTYARGGLDGGANWQISTNHSIGAKVEWNSYFSCPSYQLSSETFYKNGIQDDAIKTTGKEGNTSVNPQKLTANAYYNGTAGKLGIDFNFDVYKYDNGRQSEISESSQKSGDASVTSESKSNNILYAAKLTFSYPIWKGKLNVGTEETFTRTKNHYSITGVPGIPSSNSKVRENNYAAFASYAFLLQKAGQFNAGLRFEHVDYLYEPGDPTKNKARSYNNVFPSVSYGGAFGPVQTMLSYSMKTRRPSFDSLDDAIRYNDHYIYQSGNAALQPMTFHEISLTTSWKFLVLAVNYKKIDKLIATWSELYNKDEGVVLVKPRNLDDPYRKMSIYLNATPTVGIWSLNCTTGILPQWLTLNVNDPHNIGQKKTLSFNDKPIAFLQMDNAFKVKKGWQFEFGGNLTSGGYTENILLMNPSIDINFAIQKSLLKDGSLVIRLEGKDMIRKERWNVYADFGSHEFIQTQLYDTRRLTLSIRYNFNTTASKYKGTGAGADVIGRMSSK